MMIEGKPAEKETTEMDADAALVMNIRNGDKKALQELVERHKKTAYRMALGLVGNRDDAYDISQEAFLRVYRSAKTYDDTQPFLPWFYTIIANLCRTWLRRRTRRDYRTVDLDSVDYLLIAEDNPEAAVIKKELARQLGKALMELPFDDREIIMMQHFRGMSYEEIAVMLNIPKGTVMSRLYYARKKLAAIMRRYDG
jgi:RNA polymerase sigma-70 factor (ECF subfamily)